MLNISYKSVSALIDKSEFETFKKLKSRGKSRTFLKVLATIFLLAIIVMFLPWTQNIRSKGVVTTLNPYDKPQTIQPLIGGQLQKWYVKEGDVVSVGDTIVILNESKEDYLDPDILNNTKEQQEAKLKSADANTIKISYLKEQIKAIDDFRRSKLSQVVNKQKQVEFESKSIEQDLVAVSTKLTNAKNQLERMQLMYDKGIKPLKDLEEKRFGLREAEAKKVSLENKLNKLENEKMVLTQEREVINNSYNEKAAKIESEIRSTESYRASLLGESAKFQSKYNQIERRQNSFVLTSPINGRITKMLRNGLGEYVKPQESIVTIVPLEFQKAVELYILPNDMPLLQVGKKVRLQFDGWPAVVFSGWPNNSFGTFAGIVYAIDNDISDNGKYRIIVTEDAKEKPWPKLIRIGSGARGLLLLNEVKIYYELWRQLNGFPPDFYDLEKQKELKNKAPIKKVK